MFGDKLVSSMETTGDNGCLPVTKEITRMCRTVYLFATNVTQQQPATTWQLVGDFSIAACGWQRVSDHSLDLCDGGLLENIGNLVC